MGEPTARLPKANDWTYRKDWAVGEASQEIGNSDPESDELNRRVRTIESATQG